MPRAVVFDLGGVLIHWDPRLLYRKLLPSEEAVERFLATVCPAEWNPRLDAGLPLAEGIAERVERFPHHEPLIRAYGERFAEMMLPMPARSRCSTSSRARGVPLYALSNWAAETFERTRPLFPFLDAFDGLVISGHDRPRQARPAHLRAPARDARARGRGLLFVDDRATTSRPRAPSASRAMLFEGAAGLRAELVRRGLL